MAEDLFYYYALGELNPELKFSVEVSAEYAILSCFVDGNTRYIRVAIPFDSFQTFDKSIEVTREHIEYPFKHANNFGLFNISAIDLKRHWASITREEMDMGNPTHIDFDGIVLMLETHIGDRKLKNTYSPEGYGIIDSHVKLTNTRRSIDYLKNDVEITVSGRKDYPVIFQYEVHDMKVLQAVQPLITSNL